jgi:hypothetical protein
METLIGTSTKAPLRCVVSLSKVMKIATKNVLAIFVILLKHT